MGRNLVDAADDKTDRSSEKDTNNNSDSDSDSDLEEEEFIVEKILEMRTTRKGKVQCKKKTKKFFSFQYFYYSFILKIYSNGKVIHIVKILGY